MERSGPDEVETSLLTESLQRLLLLLEEVRLVLGSGPGPGAGHGDHSSPGPTNTGVKTVLQLQLQLSLHVLHNRSESELRLGPPRAISPGPPHRGNREKRLSAGTASLSRLGKSLKFTNGVLSDDIIVNCNNEYYWS